MRKLVVVLLLIAGSSGISFAQSAKSIAELSGKVIDQNGVPIGSTEIVLKDGNGKTFQTTTNLDGQYRFQIEGGRYSVVATYLKHQAWETFKIDRYEIAANGKMTLDICLRVSAEFSERHGSPITSNPGPVRNKLKP